MIRELVEEAGIKVESDDLELIAQVEPTKWHISRLYLLRTNVQPVLSDEHTSGSWMRIDDLQKRLEVGVAAKSSLLPKLLLLKKHLGRA